MDISGAPIRLARPSRDLVVARRFWVEGLGLDVLWESGPEAEGGHALLMLGAHARPGPEDLLVLYLGSRVDLATIERLVAFGGTRVTSPNPYWERWGATVADPDGYRLVLSHRTWK